VRAAGTLLTVLSLLAVQAPWIACHCDGEAALTSLLTGVLVHQDTEHASHAGHTHGCCDGVAHAVHGAHHAHGVHCHGTDPHDRAPGGAPEPAGGERHEGFRLALRTLPGDVDLDAPDVRADAAALPSAVAAWAALASPALRQDTDPPQRSRIPASATERLLL